jgi:hypothetical protein
MSLLKTNFDGAVLAGIGLTVVAFTTGVFADKLLLTHAPETYEDMNRKSPSSDEEFKRFWHNEKNYRFITNSHHLKPDVFALTRSIDDEDEESFKNIAVFRFDKNELAFALDRAVAHTFVDSSMQGRMVNKLVDQNATPYSATIDALLDHGKMELLRQVLEKTSDPFTLEHTLFKTVSSLNFQSEQAQRDFTLFLIEKGAKADASTVETIASQNRVDLFDMIRTAFNDSADNTKGMALHYAIEYGHTTAAAFLLNDGGLPSLRYYEEMAKQRGQVEIADMIHQKASEDMLRNQLQSLHP